MNIAALVNPVPEVRRGHAPANRSPAPAPSPAPSTSKLLTPPRTAPKPPSRKRKRHDPKPVWAVREHEVVEGEAREERQQSRPPPTTPQLQSHPPPQASPQAHSNGVQPLASRQLTGFERPVTDTGHVYDEIARKVCDFLWTNVVGNATLRNAIAESKGTAVEIEARWGQIQEKDTHQRMQGVHDTECVMRAMDHTTFQSTMSIEQHKKMNLCLNKQVQASKTPGAMRAEVNYKHTREVDLFYDLDQNGFNLLPPLTKQIIAASGRTQRIRVTRDEKTGEVLRQIIKHKVTNLEISSPQTEWDYRIGVNLEIDFPGPVEGLRPVVETGQTEESMQRKKDRVSYSWLNAYQIDLTQVRQGTKLNHELELEVNADVLIHEGDLNMRQQANQFEPLVVGMLNNLRVLSREITPQ